MIGETLPKTHPVEGDGNQGLSHKEYIEKLQQDANRPEQDNWRWGLQRCADIVI